MPDQALRLDRLVLTDVRNYARLAWEPARRLAVIHGPNGSGKTNLLEAVSLLAPGRGLRGARMAEIARRGGPGTWAVAARLRTPDGPAELGTGIVEDGANRVFRLDGAAPRGQADIAARFAAVWLTPQMDRLFQEGATGRRRFLDRLVYALDPGHARAVAAHDHAVAERNRLLVHGGDPGWLESVEDGLARHAVAVTAGRLALARRLTAALGDGLADPFPPARLSVTGMAAEALEAPAVAAEAALRRALAIARAADRAAGATSVGAHRTDLVITDADGQPAALASTGQQKALLIGVVLGHAALIAGARGFAPVLLLDEPAVHLDADRRAALFAALRRLPAQALLTGTDAETFLPLADAAAGARASDGALHPDRRFAAG